MPKLINLDNDLLRTFVVVASTQSLTRASDQLLRTQSTLSLQLKRLETQLDCVLFHRHSRHMTLTHAGREWLPHVQQFMDMHDALIDRVTGADVHGDVRLGAPEDFATTYLSSVLAQFARTYPHVALQVECDLTLNLKRAFHDGLLDIVLLKGSLDKQYPESVTVWREALVWVSQSVDVSIQRDEPLSLVLSPEPCVYRQRATQALNQAGIPWRIVYTCSSLAGTLAAVNAGLGVSVLARNMVPSHLMCIENEVLPALPQTQMSLLRRDPASAQTLKLAEHIIASLNSGGNKPET